MSVRASNWAWKTALQPTQKIVLLALADIADDAGLCWPSLKTLAVKCHVSPRTIQRTVKEFEDCGLLEITTRFAANGRQTSNGYVLRLDGETWSPFAPAKGREGDRLSPSISAGRGEGDSLSPSPQARRREGDISVTPGVTPGCRGGGDTVMTPLEPPQERQCESPLQPPPSLRWPGSLAHSQRLLIAPMLAEQARETAQQLLDELGSALALPGRIRTTPARWIAGLLRRHGRGQFVPTVEAAPTHTVSVKRAQHNEISVPPEGATSDHDPELVNRAREKLRAVAERLRVRP